MAVTLTEGPAVSPDRDRDRLELRRLDGCLTELENAHERGEVVIGPELAQRLRPIVDGLRPGMPITEAMDLVFEEQEAYLPGRSTCRTPMSPAGVPAVPLAPTASITATEPLDRSGARELTERIRSLVGNVCLLLYEARERGAPAALGYDTWERYVRNEFGMSRRRSYELLDQAHVILTLRSVAGECGIPHITPFLAGYVKAHLNEVVESIQAQLTAASADEAPTILQHMIEAEHKRFAEERRAKRLAGLPAHETEAPSTSLQSGPTIADVNVVASMRAILILAAQPRINPTPELVAAFHPATERVNSALKWLVRLARVLGESRHINETRFDAGMGVDHRSKAAS